DRTRRRVGKKFTIDKLPAREQDRLAARARLISTTGSDVGGGGLAWFRLAICVSRIGMTRARPRIQSQEVNEMRVLPKVILLAAIAVSTALIFPRGRGAFPSFPLAPGSPSAAFLPPGSVLNPATGAPTPG